MEVILLCLLILLSKRSIECADLPMNFEWTKLAMEDGKDVNFPRHEQQIFYKVRSMNNNKRRVRSISDAVVETTRCEHIDLMDCESYDSEEMTCMITATGFPCCICSGKLKLHKKRWSFW